MSIINKKSLIFLTSLLLVIISVLVLKQAKPVELSDVKLIESSNDISFAMYKKTENGYEEYKAEMFPHGYRLNLDESKCIDSNGNEIKASLKYEHNYVKLTSNKTSYCYLYFDEKENISNICNGTNMQECINNKKEEIKTIENLSTETKGNMYRYQGLATDVDNNYICFGTSDKQTCKDHPDQYMYRIIGMEESGRIKVIKKEALDQTYQWWDSNYDNNINWPESKVFKEINGTGFLDNKELISSVWEQKIYENNWLYGDMLENVTDGARQAAPGLYLIETGKKDTRWDVYSTKEDGGIKATVGIEGNSQYPKGSIVYYKTVSGKWSNSTQSKIGLLNLSDYSYAVSDEANCQYTEGELSYSKCKISWIHLSQNDSNKSSLDEWMMTRFGWNPNRASYTSYAIGSKGNTGHTWMPAKLAVRPVFYIDSNQIIESGIGAIDNPYIIK